MKTEDLINHIGKPISLLNEDRTIWCTAELKRNFNENDGNWFILIPTTGSGTPFFLNEEKIASIQIQNEELSLILPLRRLEGGYAIG